MKKFSKMYDPFTSNGFKLLDRVDGERYFREIDGFRQLISVDGVPTNIDFGDRIEFLDKRFIIDYTMNRLADAGGMLVYPVDSEEELYEAYRQANEDIQKIINDFDTNPVFKSGQITTFLNEKIYNYFTNNEAEKYTNLNELVYEVLESKKDNNSFDQFMIINCSRYISYLIDNYSFEIIFEPESGKLYLRNDKHPYIGVPRIIASLWYFGESDCLFRGRANMYYKNGVAYLGDKERYEKAFPIIFE